MPQSWKECEGQLINGQFSLIEHVGGSDHSVVFRTQRGKSQPEKAAIKFVQIDPATASAANELLGISTRIGITRAADRHLRFYQRNSPYVSGPTRLNV